MSGQRITIEDDGWPVLRVDGATKHSFAALVCLPDGMHHEDFVALLRPLLAAAPGPDPAPKVGDRVQHVHSGRFAWVEEVITDVVVNDVADLGSTRWPRDVYRVVDPHAASEGCNGRSDCAAPIHVHGCYVDRGGSICDNPGDHRSGAPAGVSETEGDQ